MAWVLGAGRRTTRAPRRSRDYWRLLGRWAVRPVLAGDAKVHGRRLIHTGATRERGETSTCLVDAGAGGSAVEEKTGLRALMAGLTTAWWLVVKGYAVVHRETVHVELGSELGVGRCHAVCATSTLRSAFAVEA